jgi:hypothetical protein
VLWDSVPFDMLMDLFLMIAVITQCVENLGQGQMGESVWNCLWSQTLPPQFDDRANRCASPHDDGLSTQNAIVGDDITMSCRGGHPNSSFLSKHWRRSAAPPTRWHQSVVRSRDREGRATAR